MKTLKPIIQTEEPDKYGRTVKVGITDGPTASFFQVMSMEEVRNLRDELTKFLNHSGVGTTQESEPLCSTSRVSKECATG